MAHMMCAQRMWRLVKPWVTPASPRPRDPCARLSDWAAVTLVDEGETLVIAREVQTYLTLVFPYGEGDRFQRAFSRALAEALEDLRVEHRAAATEVSSAVPVQLSRLTDAQLRDGLKTAEFMCGIERAYHDDLRRVQLNLNQFPHVLPPDHVPANAVLRLFRRPPLRPA